MSHIGHGNTALQAVRGGHCNAAYRIVADMLRYLQGKRPAAVLYGQRI